MVKGGKCLQSINLEIKELHDTLHDLDNWVSYLHKQIDIKDKLTETLQLNFNWTKREKLETQIENMVVTNININIRIIISSILNEKSKDTPFN